MVIALLIVGVLVAMLSAESRRDGDPGGDRGWAAQPPIPRRSERGADRSVERRVRGRRRAGADDDAVARREQELPVRRAVGRHRGVSSASR